MTDRIDWGALALLTLRDPDRAARIIVGWNLSRDILWSALALVAIVNTLLFSVSNLLIPAAGPMPAIFNNPIGFFMIVAGGLVLSVNAFFWTGRMLGAQKSDLGDLLALMIWLQALRAVAQAAVLVLAMLAPVLASILVLATGMAALWILVHFLHVGLQLPTVWRALAVLVAASVGLVLGLSLMFSMIGVTALGLAAYV